LTLHERRKKKDEPAFPLKICLVLPLKHFHPPQQLILMGIEDFREEFERQLASNNLDSKGSLLK